MKKILLVLLLVTIMVGCNKENQTDNVDVTKNYKATVSYTETIKEQVEITYEEYEQKIKNKDSFILVLWQTGCGHCEKYEPIVNKIVSKYNLKIYSINLALLDDIQYSKIENKTFVTGTPTTVAFVDGITQSKKLIGSKDEQTVIDFLVKFGYLEEIK